MKNIINQKVIVTSYNIKQKYKLNCDHIPPTKKERMNATSRFYSTNGGKNEVLGYFFLVLLYQFIPHKIY